MASEREQTRRRRRKLHEQLRAVTFEPLMRGSLVERRRKCGKPTCACARDRRALHTSKFLTVFLDGRSRGLHVRPEDADRIGAAIAAYDGLWRIVNELTGCELSDLRREARERRRGKQRRRASG